MALMTKDEFLTAKTLIKDSPLRELDKQTKIRELTKKYWSDKIYNESMGLRNRVRGNVDYLAEVFKRKPTITSIKEGMNCDIPDDLREWIVADGKLSTMRSFIILSFFYAIPLEMLMFEDLNIINKNEFIKRYHTIGRQD